jgi:hypothetical protein
VSRSDDVGLSRNNIESLPNMSDTEKKTVVETPVEEAKPVEKKGAKPAATEDDDAEFQGGDEDDGDDSIDQAEDAPDDPEEMNALNEEANLPIEELRKRYAMAAADDDDDDEEGTSPYAPHSPNHLFGIFSVQIHATRAGKLILRFFFVSVQILATRKMTRTMMKTSVRFSPHFILYFSSMFLCEQGII